MNSESMARSACVIGAGLGGLHLAAELALKGWNVTVCEKEVALGGMQKSFGRGRCVFDEGCHVLVLPETPETNVLLQRLIRFLMPSSSILRVACGDSFFDFGATSAVAAERLMERFPEEEKKLRAWFARLADINSHQRRITSIIKDLGMDVAAKALAGDRVLTAIKDMTAADLAAEVFGADMNPVLRTLLFCCWGILGEEPAALSATSWATMWAGLARGCYQPRPGCSMKDVADEYAAIIAEHGGHVMTGAPVLRLLVEAAGCRGVVVDGGAIVRCDCVVAACPAPALEHMLPGGLDALWPAKASPLAAFPALPLERTRLSAAADTLYLGIRSTPATRALLAPLAPARSFCMLADVDAAKDTAARRAMEAFGSAECDVEGLLDRVGPRFFVTLTQPAHPERDEPFVLSLVFLHASTAACDMPPAAYAAYKQRRAAALLANFERGLRALAAREGRIFERGVLLPNVEVCELHTERTVLRETGSPRGCAFGPALTPAQGRFRRFPAVTAVKGLYLAGQWGPMGPSVAGVMQTGSAVAAEVERRHPAPALSPRVFRGVAAAALPAPAAAAVAAVPPLLPLRARGRKVVESKVETIRPRDVPCVVCTVCGGGGF